MSQIPQHTRHLASLVNRPGGITEDEAVTAATANLESMRDRTVVQIEATLVHMHEIAQALQTPNPAMVDELYASSNMLIGVAGAFGMDGVSTVAYSLCELIDRLRTSRTWNVRSIRIHVDSLRLMQHAEPGGLESVKIHEALRSLVERVPTTAG